MPRRRGMAQALQHSMIHVDIMQQLLYTMSLFAPDLSGGRVMKVEQKWKTALEQRMLQAESLLSPRRRKLVRSIVENAEDTYYLSSREMARRYNVDAATVVRTIQVLGYKQFSDFISDLRAHFVTRISPYRIMGSATREHRSIEEHVQHTRVMDRANFNAIS